jgi:hypothetical protein
MWDRAKRCRDTAKEEARYMAEARRQGFIIIDYSDDDNSSE